MVSVDALMSLAAKKKQLRPLISKACGYRRLSTKQSDQLRPNSIIILGDMHNIISFIPSLHSATSTEIPFIQQSRPDAAHAAAAHTHTNPSCTLQHPSVLMFQTAREEDGSVVWSTSASAETPGHTPNNSSFWPSSRCTWSN